MQYTMQNIEFTCADKNLTPNEKLEAIQNELLEDSYYSEVDNIYGEGNLCNLDIEDWGEEQYNTNLPSEYLEVGIDAGLREFVRLVHANAQCDVTQQQIDNFDRLDDVMTIDNFQRDKRKFFVMNTPGYDIKYHSLPGGGLSYELIRSNSPYTRKVVRNEEGNFEDVEDDDKPDWLIKLLKEIDETNKENRITHQTKILWKAIRDSREEYQKWYNKLDSFKGLVNQREGEDKERIINLLKQFKDKGDEAYKEYKRYSNAMDEVKKIDAKIEQKRLEKQADILLHLFVTFQQACPDDLVDSVLWEDIKAKYKSQGFEVTKYYLIRLICRVDAINQQRQYKKEETA